MIVPGGPDAGRTWMRVVATSAASTPVGVSVIRCTVRTSSAEPTSSPQASASSAPTSTE